MADGTRHDQVVGKVLTGAVEGLSDYNGAIESAKKAGHNDIAQFLRDVQEQDRARLRNASELLQGLITNEFW